jgi:hypothetical protein
MTKQTADMELMTRFDGIKTITVEEFGKMSDTASDDIDDVPQWVVNSLDTEARRIGVSHQGLTKSSICEKLEAK